MQTCMFHVKKGTFQAAYMFLIAIKKWVEKTILSDGNRYTQEITDIDFDGFSVQTLSSGFFNPPGFGKSLQTTS